VATRSQAGPGPGQAAGEPVHSCQPPAPGPVRASGGGYVVRLAAVGEGVDQLLVRVEERQLLTLDLEPEAQVVGPLRRVPVRPEQQVAARLDGERPQQLTRLWIVDLVGEGPALQVDLLLGCVVQLDPIGPAAGAVLDRLAVAGHELVQAKRRHIRVERVVVVDAPSPHLAAGIAGHEQEQEQGRQEPAIGG
jgi:hypothetical protein